MQEKILKLAQEICDDYWELRLGIYNALDDIERKIKRLRKHSEKLKKIALAETLLEQEGYISKEEEKSS